MKNIEDMLNKQRQEIDSLTVPDEMDIRLIQALKDRGIKTRKRRDIIWMSRVVAILLVMVLIGYNFNTLAYYSKRFIGYDNVMNGTLKELNKLGKGQVIEKSYTFKNGITITLDGIMIDENQMLAFYSINDQRGGIDSGSYHFQLHFKGLFERYNMRGGQGKISDDKREIKWINGFETPSFYEKKLTFTVELIVDGMMEEGEISFEIDRAKAMSHSLKKKIKKEFKKGDIKVKLDAIIASPTRTVINGSIQSPFDLVKEQLVGDGTRPNYMVLKLVANNQEVMRQGSEVSTGIKGITFQQEFDPLPEDLNSLEIHLESLSVDTEVSERIEILKDTNNLPINIKGKAIEINKVEERNGSTFVTITSQEDLLLSRVHLLVDSVVVELRETINVKQDKLLDGTIMNTRTLHFPVGGENVVLVVDRISYVEDFDDVINVPIK